MNNKALSIVQVVKTLTAVFVVGVVAFTGLSALASGTPGVTTFDVVGVGQNSATFLGHEAQSTTEHVITWFEYATNASFTNGFSTGHDIISYPQSANTNFSAQVSGLSAGTTYYVRAVAKNTFGTSHGGTKIFTTSGGNPPPPPPGSQPSVTTNSATSVGTSNATVNATVNPNGKNTSAWFEWGTSQSLGNSTSQKQLGAGNSALNVNEFLNGLSPNTTYYFRAVAQNSSGTNQGSILSFSTQGSQSGSAPTAITNSASGVGQNSATLNGTVNPNGSFTNGWFEYGTTLSLGSTIGNQSIGSGNNSTPLSFTIQNLSQNTTYYFRVVGSNTNGITNGSILSFTTQGNQQQGFAPFATTNSAFSITQNSANLQGLVHPNGLQTNAWFEWGTSQALGNSTGSQSVGSGNGSIAVNASLFGLSQNTTYYYRLVAQNNAGTALGSILSFTTQSGNTGGSGLPTVWTVTANSVFLAGATLNGTVSPNGSFTSAWFEYGTSPGFGGNTVGFQSIGSSNFSSNFSFNLSNLQTNTTYYFRAVAQNSFGTNYGSLLSFTTGNNFQGNIPGVTTLGANSITQNSAFLQGTANSNTFNTNAWFEWGTSQSLGNSVGHQQLGNNFGNTTFSTVLSNLNPNTTYYFRAVAQTGGGTGYGAIFSFTTSGGTGNSPNTPFVSTNGASFIEINSAQLNSTVDPRGSFTTARFEWGTTLALGNTTQSRDLGSGFGTAQFSLPITNLSANTVYYYRVVAQNQFGISQGTIVNFRTRPVFTNPPPVFTPPPAVPPTISPSLVIEPEVDRNEPAPDSTITYTLRYRNENGANGISGVVTRIMLPENLTFVSSGIQPASQSARELVFNLGALAPGANGTLEIRLRVNENAEDGESLVIGAVANYVDASNRSQSTSAYLTLTVNSSGFLAALFGLDIPLGWILLLILIALVAFFAARRLGGGGGSHEPASSQFMFKRATPPGH